MKALPAATRAHLPSALRRFKSLSLFVTFFLSACGQNPTAYPLPSMPYPPPQVTSGPASFPIDKLIVYAVELVKEAVRGVLPVSTPVPGSTPVTGISQFEAPPYNTDTFKPGNAWADYVDGAFVIVYAGARGQNEAQGVLAIVEAEREELVDTPTQHGLVKVTAATGDTLTLTAADGTTFVFDVSERTFLPTPTP